MVDRLYVYHEVESTNLCLLEKNVDAQQLSGAVCVAETQSAGRGRRGRAWIATPYCNVMLSASWHFEPPTARLAGLSLAAAVSTVRALQDYGVGDLGLKWPNDIVWHEKKLGGLLVETRSAGQQSTLAIVGLGINVRLAEDDAALIDQPWVDLATIIGVVDRNRLVAYIITRLHEMFREFTAMGFAPFQPEWERLDAFSNRWVHLRQGEHTIEGQVLGVDDSGGLRVVDSLGIVKTFYTGDISMRPAT
ncbi:MAG: biotin--[acetyl-CoA-carboxylase] ligase [Gammaproteobacteria bacterium]|nr:biotin--[acetyl-CoA-carboxylase] ligase [Gammaproteobacteria bacterium]